MDIINVGGARPRSGSRSSSRTPPPSDLTGDPLQQQKKHPNGDASTKQDARVKRPKKSPQEQESIEPSPQFKSSEEAINYFIQRPPLPANPPRLTALSENEIKEIERVLEFSGRSEGWRDDWSGNLAYADEEILNPIGKGREKQSFRQSLIDWASNSPDHCRLLHNLIRYVYHMPETPLEAKQILASASRTSAQELEIAIRRTSYDPVVLRQDGWTTTKSEVPIGATGGPFMIGEMIRWQNEDAVVIAYVHDNEIGDLWKGVWIDTQNFITFDMEAEEVHGAKQKYDRRKNPKLQTTDNANFRKSSRYALSEDFTVKGVEHGIILASSGEKGARPGVFWPARVMHASETSGSSSQAKRSSAKQKVEVVFLAPYWNSNELGSRGRRTEALSENGDSFRAGDLFHLELIEASGEVIKEFPYDPSKGLDLDQLRMSFRFTGLPKGAFQRFLDSHRLALALKAYAVEKASNFSASDLASAGLFETHPMAVQAPVFPYVILHLPFSYILSELPSLTRDGSENETKPEPIIQISTILNSMKPPQCWSSKSQAIVHAAATEVTNGHGPRASVSDTWLASIRKAKGSSTPLEIQHFAGNLPRLEDFLIRAAAVPAIEALQLNVTNVVAAVSVDEADSDDKRREKLATLTKSWTMLKSQGDEAIASIRVTGMDEVRADWRRACERIYQFITSGLSSDAFGNGFCNIITDARCNLHRTSGANFERSVRLPAALLGARQAGAGTEIKVPLISVIPDHYVNYVENDLLKKAHSTSYLKRMKGRCAAATTDDFMLTEDSDGNGGQDTHGSRGTWTAAVCGVAAAVCAVDRIVTGECVNAFCATRPPGHHAGRSLHPMKAVSNGFCVLNAAACAAIHATTPVSQGGCGLGKVCILDFDVHHGNGTQDILCSTYDPRFLYVSIHAGGKTVNGTSLDIDDDPQHELHDLASNPKSGGIYPGRCGDSSPHSGVLNIPLGAKVTSHAVGTALLSRVTPVVDAFSPDLIILSAGFDAHKHDPMLLGALSADDFGHITEVACQLAFKSCSGRLLSVLEGGYGVPCCRPQVDIFLPAPKQDTSNEIGAANNDELLLLTQQSTASALSQQAAEVSEFFSEFVPESQESATNAPTLPPPVSLPAKNEQPQRPQPSKLLDLGADLPDDMDDQVPYALQRRLEKCHLEGFVECVKEHVAALVKCSNRKEL